jgi:iron complex outermembrane receptor protein
MTKKKSFHRRALTSAVACILAPTGLFAVIQNVTAQESTSGRSGGLEQVVVTAQRKSELLQEVPLSVNVMMADSLAQKGLATTDDLQAAVPGLEFVSTGGAGTPFLRGVGSNAGNPNDEPSVATYVDGVYIASPYANLMSFNNLERVEVLKGPQGTLFGRNATGGVIQLITRDPSHTASLEVAAGYANYATSSGSIYGTGELTENLAADIAVQVSIQDEGWGYNAVRQEDTYEAKSSSVRSKFLYTPNDALEVRIALDYAELENNMADYKLPNGVTAADGVVTDLGDYDTRGIITLDGIGAPGVVERQSGIAIIVNYDTDLLTFVSTSAYRNNTGVYNAEADTTPVPVVEAKLPIMQSNVSQEFQLMSNSDSWLDWTVGAYLYESRAGYKDLIFSGLGLAPPNSPLGTIGRLELYTRQDTTSQSVYAQGDAEVFADTKLTAGLRYTHERQSQFAKVFGSEVPAPKDRGFDEPTWRLALDHGFSDDVHAYISYNRGVKGGGFDLLSPGADGYDPETLDAYEIGLKSEWFDNRVRVNVAYFYYDYKDIQVQVIPAGQGGGIVQTTNAAAATIQGLDVDFQLALVDNLTISGGFTAAKGEYDDFPSTTAYSAGPGLPQEIDASGNDTIRMPKFDGNLSATYEIPSTVGTFPVSITYSHTGKFYFGADNRLQQDAYGLLNASIGWTSVDERYGLSFWGRNLTDEYYLVQGVPSSTGDLTAPGAPRTYGVTVSAKFGG